MQVDREQPLDLANSSGAPDDFLDELVVPPVASHSLRVAAALVYSLVCILGLLGNLLVLRLVRGIGGRSRGAIDCLVFNLALADFHFVLALPFWAAELALDYSWPFGHAMCKLVLFVTVLNVYASVFFLTAMSVSRYWAAVQTLRPGRAPCRPQAIQWVSLAIWLAAGAASLPPAIYSRTIQVDGEELCVQSFPNGGHWPEVYKIQRVAVTFVAPLVVICTSYALLLRLLRGHTGDGALPDAPTNLTRLVVVIVTAFFLCWLPNHVIAVWEVLVRLGLARWGRAYYIAHAYVHPLTICLANANSCLNPVIYCLMRKEFREAVRRSLMWRAGVPSRCCIGHDSWVDGHSRGQVDLPLQRMDGQAICSSGSNTPCSISSAATQKI